MKTSLLSRAAALVSSVALVAAVTVVPSYAANFTANDVTVTYSGDNLGVDDTLTVSIDAGVVTSDGDVVTVTIRDDAGAVVDLTGAVLVGAPDANTTFNGTDLANGQFTMTVTAANTAASVALNTFDATEFASGLYYASFVTDNNTPQIGAISFGVNGGNQVVVSATVEPILMMAVTTSGNSQASGGTTPLAQSFGVLNPALATTIEIADLEVGTNALTGVAVQAQSTNGGLTSTTASWKITEDAANVAASGGDPADHTGEVYDITSVINDNADDLVAGVKNGAVANDVIDQAGYVAAAGAIYAGTTGERFDVTDDITVSLTAQPTTVTPAATDYTDTITFTTTANF